LVCGGATELALLGVFPAIAAYPSFGDSSEIAHAVSQGSEELPDSLVWLLEEHDRGATDGVEVQVGDHAVRSRPAMTWRSFL
jgi:hypothetical protein